MMWLSPAMQFTWMTDQVPVVTCQFNHQGLGPILVYQFKISLKLVWLPLSSGPLTILPIFSAFRQKQNFTPIDFLHLFFSEAFLNLVMDQCNLYDQQYIYQNPSPCYSSPFEWKPTTIQEFKVFFGLTLNM